MKLLLRSKHWQLFLVLFGVTFAAPFIVDVKEHFQVLVIMGMICAFLAFLWVWSIGVAANRKVPPELQRSPRFFTAGCFYVPAFAALYFYAADPTNSAASASPSDYVFSVGYFLASVAGIYVYWYAAKQLAILRRGGKHSLLDVFIAFFLLWIFPLGVWFIQPLVNRELAS